MKRLLVPFLFAGLLGAGAAHAESAAVTGLLTEFKAAGAGPFNAEAGKPKR